jgi:preprotein translocase subunit SecE
MNFFAKIKGFLREVWEEFRGKCTFPSRSELTESAWIIVFTMVVLGIFIFVMDLGISQALAFLLGTNV